MKQPTLSRNKPYYSPQYNASEDESLFQLDTKLYNSEEIEHSHSSQQIVYLTPPPSPKEEEEAIGRNMFGKVSSSRNCDDHFEAFDSLPTTMRTYQKGKLRIPPSHLKRIAKDPQNYVDSRKTMVNFETGSNFTKEDIHDKTNHSEFETRPIKLLDKSKRIALQAFSDTVKRMESTLKKPLYVYLKEHEGNGFFSAQTTNKNLVPRRDDKLVSPIIPSFLQQPDNVGGSFNRPLIRSQYPHYNRPMMTMSDIRERQSLNVGEQDDYVMRKRRFSPPYSPVLDDNSPLEMDDHNHFHLERH